MNLPKSDYIHTLNELKEKIRQARTRAFYTVNAELLKLYWEIGYAILEQQKLEGWGAKVIKTLSIDLKTEFPDFKGLSIRNLTYMRDFAEAYPLFGHATLVRLQQPDSQENTILQQPAAKLDNPSMEIMQQVAAKLPWGHHQVLLDKLKTSDLRLFYMEKCIENGWGRNILTEQIENKLHERIGKTISNFQMALSPIQSDLAQQTFKNPYVFDFLSIGEEMKERDLEKALIEHLKKFMLELGKGFAYVGNQKNLVVDGDDFFLDLLFFNYALDCFVLFELKIGDFKPEYAGKLNFYINTVDEQLRSEGHQPTIGVLLCKTPNETVIKYSLKGIATPIGVSEYILANALPPQLTNEMPSIEELEAEIDREYEELKTPTQKRFDNLKEKLLQLKQEEIKEVATTPILFDIFDKSLMPLFQSLLKRMEDFKDLFMSNSYHWQGIDQTITDIALLSPVWKDEEFLKKTADFYFSYRLHGLKKLGTNGFNVGFELHYKIDTYWYGLVLVNYNNQQPFIKKLYHEQLSHEEIAMITDLIYNSLLENIERQLEYLNQNSK